MKNELEFAVSHVLRELGFHKESEWYFIKSNGEINFFKINKNNFWKIQHADWNSCRYYYKELGEEWKTPWNGVGIPYYRKYDGSGYICTIPTFEQISDFCSKRMIPIDCTNYETVLRSLITYYRLSVKNQEKAFEKYLKKFKLNETVH